MKTYLINMITSDVEAGPGTVQEMVDAANEAIRDGADHKMLEIATVTHSFIHPPAVAVEVDRDVPPTTIAEAEAKSDGTAND